MRPLGNRDCKHLSAVANDRIPSCVEEQTRSEDRWWWKEGGFGYERHRIWRGVLDCRRMVECLRPAHQ